MGTAGPGPGSVAFAVRAVTAADFADSPAEFVAATWNWYAVSALSPVTVVDVPLTVCGAAPSRYTL